MSENVQEIDKNALFLQAIQERMAQMVVEYETKVAELRVEYTVVSQERDQLNRALSEMLEDREKQDAVQKSPDEAE
jgi:uncharacterized protein YeeX (DUF496 family)